VKYYLGKRGAQWSRLIWRCCLGKWFPLRQRRNATCLSLSAIHTCSYSHPLVFLLCRLALHWITLTTICRHFPRYGRLQLMNSSSKGPALFVRNRNYFPVILVYFVSHGYGFELGSGFAVVVVRQGDVWTFLY